MQSCSIILFPESHKYSAMKSKPIEKGPVLAYDDDTSDSDDDQLNEFNSRIGSIKPPPAFEESDTKDDSDEERDYETDTEKSHDSSEEDSESESEAPLKVSVEKVAKLSKLKDQLAALEDEESDDSDAEEENVGNVEEESEDSDEQDDEEIDETQSAKIKQNPESLSMKRPAEDGEKTENCAKVPKVEEINVEDKERLKYREKLSKMSIEDIQKLKERLGLKLFHQKMSGTAPVRGQKINFKRENKNRPREMSSKKTVGRFREVVQVAKVQKRDPRFDPLCGEFDEKLFKDNYKFVNEIKSQDLTFLKKQLREEEDPERRKSIKYLIQRTENQLRQEAQNKMKEEQENAEKNEKKEQLQSGVKPFYISKSKQKEMKLVDQYEKLKESGGLDKYIRKKTKKNLVKDRKKFENL